jgi:hypothetical protein
LAPEFHEFPMQRVIALNAQLRQLQDLLAEFVLPP